MPSVSVGTRILRMAVECWWLRDYLGGMAGLVFVS